MGNRLNFQCVESCNKCGKVNKVEVTDQIDHIVTECDTTCNTCGFKDFWALGHFESSQVGYNKSKRY